MTLPKKKRWITHWVRPEDYPPLSDKGLPISACKIELPNSALYFEIKNVEEVNCPECRKAPGFAEALLKRALIR